jgi:outer membrane protein OmpA-like peptidoglycan-associated protein
MLRLLLILKGFFLFTSLLSPGCTGYTPGPDKHSAGAISGAMIGAGSGAVTGFQLGSLTGPGAIVGAGFGAVSGGMQGIAQDFAEQELHELNEATEQVSQRAYAQEILAEHYQRRMELHPARDIYPADMFFYADGARVKANAVPILRELAILNRDRLPWSRLVVASYIRTRDEDSEYALNLASDRARAIGDFFVRYGIEPRRIEARALFIEAPLVLDPYDDPLRYNQAIEFITIDR